MLDAKPDNPLKPAITAIYANGTALDNGIIAAMVLALNEVSDLS
jgi:hypothetical protein